MQTLWSRAFRARSTCQCPSCFSTQALAAPRINNATARRRLRNDCVLTLFYSTAIATAAVVDGETKKSRRNELDNRIASEKAQLQSLKEEQERRIGDLQFARTEVPQTQYELGTKSVELNDRSGNSPMPLHGHEHYPKAVYTSPVDLPRRNQPQKEVGLRFRASQEDQRPLSNSRSGNNARLLAARAEYRRKSKSMLQLLLRHQPRKDEARSLPRKPRVFGKGPLRPRSIFILDNERRATSRGKPEARFILIRRKVQHPRKERRLLRRTLSPKNAKERTLIQFRTLLQETTILKLVYSLCLVHLSRKETKEKAITRNTKRERIEASTRNIKLELPIGETHSFSNTDRRLLHEKIRELGARINELLGLRDRREPLPERYKIPFPQYCGPFSRDLEVNRQRLAVQKQEIDSIFSEDLTSEELISRLCSALLRQQLPPNTDIYTLLILRLSHYNLCHEAREVIRAMFGTRVPENGRTRLAILRCYIKGGMETDFINYANWISPSDKTDSFPDSYVDVFRTPWNHDARVIKRSRPPLDFPRMVERATMETIVYGWLKFGYLDRAMREYYVWLRQTCTHHREVLLSFLRYSVETKNLGLGRLAWLYLNCLGDHNVSTVAYYWSMQLSVLCGAYERFHVNVTKGIRMGALPHQPIPPKNFQISDDELSKLMERSYAIKELEWFPLTDEIQAGEEHKLEMAKGDDFPRYNLYHMVTHRLFALTKARFANGKQPYQNDFEVKELARDFQLQMHQTMRVSSSPKNVHSPYSTLVWRPRLREWDGIRWISK